ncbi:unnamed protein product [Tuber aestivum]|uniref:Microbial-type PARG catalytic domain-containing protein n=1 Tax=Tuber aestivum TaxID=59557 RepID=A0A292Q5D6_9PEZI|nr:unnamed protein product [Tuber aestivum]
MPSPPRQKNPGGNASGKKLVQTKLDFYLKDASSPPSSLSSSAENRSANPTPGAFGRRYIREDSAEHKEFGTSDLGSQSQGTDSQETGVESESQSRERVQQSLGKSKPQNARHSQERVDIARETTRFIPSVLAKIPAAQRRSSLYTGEEFSLAGVACPEFTLPDPDPEAGRRGCRIKVINGDTFDTAIAMGKDVVVLNMANAHVAGGGWKMGAMAQEEELCYRYFPPPHKRNPYHGNRSSCSTLSFKLHRAYYPLLDVAGIYTPAVVVFRSSHSDGHKLYPPNIRYKTLSVISVAAVRDPPLTDSTPPDYRRPTDRNLMLEKIRLILRIAAKEGHRKIVLGALGCGAFHNPPGRVVECFLRVFREPEFAGGWWREVVFAVLDTEKDEENKGPNGNGNFGVFFRGLHGVVV